MTPDESLIAEAPERTWSKIVTTFREVCILRKQGRLDEAKRILESDLPKMISLWSQSSPEEIVSKRRELENMFRTEEKKIDDAWLVQKLVATRLTEDLVPSLCSQIAAGLKEVVTQQLKQAQRPALPVRRLRTPLDAGVAGKESPISMRAANAKGSRVPLDDIPGMIDAVLAAQRDELSRRAAPAMA
jgi:hypothetical protein